MARNAERANAVLNKWLAVKDAVVKGVVTRERRPRDISSCNDLKQAEKWYVFLQDRILSPQRDEVRQ